MGCEPRRSLHSSLKALAGPGLREDAKMVRGKPSKRKLIVLGNSLTESERWMVIAARLIHTRSALGQCLDC